MTHSLTTTTTSLIGFAILAAVMLLSAPRAEAAMIDQATFMRLQSQLELLRANFTQFRTGSSTAPRASSTKAVNRSCMQEAVNTRENKIMEAGYTYAYAMRSAMEKRKASFATVWTGTEVTNQTTYRQIWSQWKRDSEAARKKLQENRKTAWQTFRDTAVKSCKATLPKEESATQDASTSSL